MSRWLWHVFHDPMADNPWSLLLLFLILAAMLGALWSIDKIQNRRKK